MLGPRQRIPFATVIGGPFGLMALSVASSWTTSAGSFRYARIDRASKRQPVSAACFEQERIEGLGELAGKILQHVAVDEPDINQAAEVDPVQIPI